MGSCVSKKAARAGGAKAGKVAAPLPVVEKENAHAQLPPVPEVDEEEVKEVVLSETPVPRPPPPPEPVKRRQQQQPEADNEAAAETCSAASVASAVIGTEKKAEKGKVHKAGGGERELELELEVEKRAVDAPPEKKKTTAPEERESRKPKQGAGAGGVITGRGRARSPSPSSAHRRQQQQNQSGGQHQPPPAPRRRREQPAVVSGIGCRSGRFSPSAARRAAESAAVRRTHSAREADMALPSSSKRSLSLNNAAAAGHGGGGSGAALISGRDPGERSGRRSDSPTGSSRRAPASPTAATAIHQHRSASPVRKAAKELGTPERARAALVGGGGGGGGAGGEQMKKLAAEGEDGALGQNPSVAMECFIFL